jgi:hypothetical protein
MHVSHDRYLPLGKLPPQYDPRTLQLAKYVTHELPAAPAKQIWSAKVKSWPMYMNDKIGNCAIAGPAHMVQGWSANAKKLVTIPDEAVLKGYQDVGGYQPGKPATDGGCIMLNVMKYWAKTGIGGHKIGAYASVSPRSTLYVQDAIYLFGGLNTGFALPVTAQNQSVWDVVPGAAKNQDAQPGSWGGHCVNIIDYDARSLTCVTWGALKKITWAFFKLYCDEAYAIISQDFLSGGKAPNGFDVASLQTDLTALR